MIGAQLFGIRNEYAKDSVGVLRALKEMGYESIEPMVSTDKRRSIFKSWTTAELQTCYTEAKAIGLEIPSVHLNLGLFGKPAEQVIDTIRYIKLHMGISVFVISGMFGKEKSAKKWGELLRKVSDAVKEDGCTILYHNHDMELRMLSDKRALDLFFEYAGPDVGLQLDIGWAGIAWDELEAAKKYADRIVEIHCKDFYGEKSPYPADKKTREKFAPIGEGIIRTREILEMARTFPRFNGVVIVDQDNSAGDMMEDLRIGFQNLREMGL